MPGRLETEQREKITARGGCNPQGKSPAEVMQRLRAILENTEHQDYFDRHARRYNFLLNRISRFPRSGKVLDVGASPGHVTALCAALGHDIFAADLYPHKQFPAVSGRAQLDLFNHLRLPVVAADAAAGALPFRDGSFSLVLFNETLEHLTGSPLPAVKELARVLAPGGILVITTPNAASLRNRIALLLGGNIHTPLKVAVNVAPYKCHNREYTLAEVVELAGMAGLKPVRATCHNVGRPISGAAKKIARAIYYTITRLVPRGRSLLLVIARKPGGSNP